MLPPVESNLGLASSFDSLLDRPPRGLDRGKEGLPACSLLAPGRRWRVSSGAVELPDCQTCGACCCNPDENRAEGYLDYIEVRRGERLSRKRALLHRFTVVNQRGERHMKLIETAPGEERCAALQGALGERVRCLIYDDRLAGCRKVEAGSRRCLQYRRERGLA